MIYIVRHSTMPNIHGPRPEIHCNEDTDGIHNPEIHLRLSYTDFNLIEENFLPYNLAPRTKHSCFPAISIAPSPSALFSKT